MPTHDFTDIGDVLNWDLLQGIITAIDSATDTCMVNVSGAVVPGLLFYHCTPASEIRTNGAISGAAKGFAVNDPVIVLKRHDNSVIKVIGHVDGIRRCTGTDEQFYIFYVDGTVLKIANCRWDGAGITVLDTKNAPDVGVTNPSNYPVKFLLKRFTHNVPVNGIPVARDLYFISTSLELSGRYIGWTNFATDNPTFPLVTNNENTKIVMTPQVLSDLNNVNYAINHNNIYIQHPSGEPDVWHILVSGEGGNCSDFALTKAQALLNLGYPASAIHIETGIINSTLSHAWLVVQTTGGDYALDISGDTVLPNSSLIPIIGGTFYSRHRQIGNNWAFMSPFGWLDSAVNTNQIYQYILDPLLNILYLLYSADGGLFTWYSLPGFNIFSTSVNFSANSNDIYVQYEYLGSPNESHTRKYKLEENKLTFVSELVNSVFGLVKNDGTIFNPSSGNRYKIISKNGYYDYLVTELIDSQPQAIISLETDNPFYSEGGYYHTSFGETISPESESYPYRWCHIEKGDIAIQAFWFLMWGGNDNSPRANYIIPRMYKNSVSCLSDVIAAVGTTEANLFGLAYIPSTNRLN